MAKYTNTDFADMYAGFRAAMMACEAQTGRSFRMQRDCSVWVSCAPYDYVDYSGVPARAKAVKEWKVPAARFWQGGKFPAILAPVKIVELPAVDWSGWQAFVKEHAAAADRLADKHAAECKAKEAERAAEWKAGEPARRAKEERERQERAEYEARRVAQQQAQIAAKKARDAEKARLRKALRAKPAKPAAAPGSPASVDGKMAEIVSNVVNFEREKTMESFRKAAEVTGRVVPENSVAQDGAGGTVYLYAKSGVTSKGKPWTQFYAKAFRPAQRKHAWHHVFTTEAERAAKVAEFLANVSEVVS